MMRSKPGGPWPRILFAILWMGAGGAARAEEIVLFDADRAGASDWSRRGTEAAATEPGWVVSLVEPPGADGEIYLAGQMPRVPGGFLDVSATPQAGALFSLDVLCFKAGRLLDIVPVIAQRDAALDSRFRLDDLPIRPETESVSFRIAVSGSRSGQVRIARLAYGADLKRARVLADREFARADEYGPAALRMTPVEEGVEIALEEGASSGSFRVPDRLPLGAGHVCLIGLRDLEAGTVEAEATYQRDDGMGGRSISALQLIRPGWHGFATALFPEAAPAGFFRLTLTLRGDDASRAVISRLLVLAPRS